MKMTQTHFELIAAATKAAMGCCENRNDYTMVAHVANKLADALATTNPRFDRAKFLEACGVQS